MSINNFKIAKNFAKKIVDELRSDLRQVVRTNAITGIDGEPVAIDGLTVDGGSITVDQIVTASVTTSSGPGAIALTGSVHEITTTGTGDALTLADGSVGQHLFITYTAEGAGTDTAILTPTTLLGANTTITFNDVGDSAHLIFTSTGWVFVGGEAVLA